MRLFLFPLTFSFSFYDLSEISRTLLWGEHQRRYSIYKEVAVLAWTIIESLQKVAYIKLQQTYRMTIDNYDNSKQDSSKYEVSGTGDGRNGDGGLPLVQCVARARIPTTQGPDIFLHLYSNNRDNKEHLAIVFGEDIRSRSLFRRRQCETQQDRMIDPSLFRCVTVHLRPLRLPFVPAVNLPITFLALLPHQTCGHAVSSTIQ